MNESHPQHLFESFYQTAELNILKNFYVNSNYNGLNLPDVPLFRKHSLDPLLSPDILENEIGPVWLPNTLLGSGSSSTALRATNKNDRLEQGYLHFIVFCKLWCSVS